MTRRSSSLALGAGCALALLTACGGSTASDPLESGADAVTGTRVERSLVVTDAAILARFGFDRTMSALRSTALGSGQTFTRGETRLAIYQRWMRSFGVGADGCDRASVDPNDYGLVCPRAPEAKLATVDPFAAGANVSFVPVGLFNRFDLMPGDGAHCGEYRVVYAMRTRAGAPLAGRGFIIFEAALPNPSPELGVDGCLPVAEFWQQLTDDGSAVSRGAKLDAFYYGGTAIPGVVPVIRAANYGLVDAAGTPAQRRRVGQIRTNFFVDNREWQLREFKLRSSCPTTASCSLAFDHVTVKTNPAEELFAGTHPRSADFAASVPSQVASLASADLNAIAMSVSNEFNEFESVSQAQNVVYANAASSSLRSAIAAELTRLGSTLTVNQTLDRATTQTCAGCHQVSNNRALGGGLVWPSSLGFVHIDESGRLSPALTNVFLPHRLAVLEDFITARETTATDAARTITSRPLDAAN